MKLVWALLKTLKRGYGGCIAPEDHGAGKLFSNANTI